MKYPEVSLWQHQGRNSYAPGDIVPSPKLPDGARVRVENLGAPYVTRLELDGSCEDRGSRCRKGDEEAREGGRELHGGAVG